MDIGPDRTAQMTTQATITLIVDDDPGSIHMVSTALEENGMTVLVARDGATAIDLVGRVQPDVILMDAVMPGLDGFETCRRLKAAPIRTPAPIIFMTGLGETEDILRGLQAGGVDYVTKPVNVDELVARMTTHIVTARQVNSARTALDANGRAVASFAPDGGLNWASRNAERMLQAAGLDQMAASGQVTALRAWLLANRTQAISRIDPLVLNDVLFSAIGANEDGGMLVRLSEGSPASRIGLLSVNFGLTPREAEVLLWVAQGKTNRDIGQILNLSGRTINKHLEQVFAKMGVDNRTSAALAASRVI